jgi:hypothetical protein
MLTKVNIEEGRLATNLAMVSPLGDVAAPTGDRDPDRGREELSSRPLLLATLKRDRAGCVVAEKAVHELQPSGPETGLLARGYGVRGPFFGPCRVQHSSVFAAALRPTLETVLLNRRGSAP